MNNNKESYPLRSFLHYFDQQVLADSPAPAQTFEFSDHSYAQLAAMAQRLRASLEQKGVKAGDKVAVGIARSEALLPLLLSIWSLRAAYVPVDPTYPASRQSYILEHAGVELLINDVPVEGLQYTGSCVTLSSMLAPSVARDDGQPLAADDVSEADTAYIIYTSGSTGNPKGVAVSQGNMLNFLLGMRDQPGLNKQDTLLAVTTISFDIHVLELFLPLMVGAHIVLASKEQSVSQQALQTLIDQYSISVMQATPATWRMLLSQGWLPQTPLKVLVGGEALPRDLRPQLHAASYELWNMYGPTETTVWSTCQKIDERDDKIYIGRPIRQTTVYVVDEHLQALEDGAVGELLIGGAGVAQGYYNSPELTNERFVELPQMAAGRLYRTGDAVIKHASGVLEYVNRLDNQIKIRGFRIEPADIEHALERHPAVKQAVVVASAFADHDLRLVAFYLGEPIASAELLKHCGEHLPAHLLPQHVVQLTQLPMTANLKVDRKQLAADAPRYVDTTAAGGSSDSRDDLDRSLVAVWERALGFKGISIDDNFFALGGHSLLALQVIKDMCVATGLNFPETTLFEAPTIRSARDRMGDEVDRAASVIKLNDTQSGDPVFCLCGVKIYQDLADQFGRQRPVYGVFAKMELDFIDAQQSQHEICFDFDALVQSYVDAILRQGEVERITLVGLSFGGLVALEAANKFRSLGVTVSEVVLLDSYMNTSSYRSTLQTLCDMSEQLREGGFHELRRDLTRRLRAQLSKRKRRALRYFSVQEAEGQREQAFENAAAHFHPAHKHYPFDALLIKASHTDFGFGRRPKGDYGLREMIGGQLTIHSVPAAHTAMIAGESAAQVYQIISDYQTTRQ